MANVSGQGGTWNLLNYAGDLFSSSQKTTPLLNLMGGLSRAQVTSNFEFPCASNYALASATQPARTETQSLTAPTANEVVRDQVKNVTQIFDRQIALSYVKLSNSGRLSGINTVGATNAADDEFAFQEATNMMEIVNDINYSFHNGAYQIATGVTVANKTLGLVALAAANTTAAAGGADISEDVLGTLIIAMEAAGALFQNPVLFCGAAQYFKISKAFGFAPMDRNTGGIDIKNIIAPIIGNLPVVYDKNMPAATICIYDMAVVRPVVQLVPGKELFAPEPLAKSGANESWLMFGQVGLNHGPVYAHGSITGLGT